MKRRVRARKMLNREKICHKLEYNTGVGAGAQVGKGFSKGESEKYYGNEVECKTVKKKHLKKTQAVANCHEILWAGNSSHLAQHHKMENNITNKNFQCQIVTQR